MAITVAALLSLIVFAVLILPLTVSKVEENLELFLFVAGLSAVSVSGQWSWHLTVDAFKDPVFITLAVFVLGIIFKLTQKRFRGVILTVSRKTGLRPILFLTALVLGLFSSVITAIVAAVILSEIARTLGLTQETKVKFIVFSCFAIGLGAVLTPIGEPLATITISKLKGPPHYADFFFLFRILGVWVIPGVIVFSVLAGFVKQKRPSLKLKKDAAPSETVKSMTVRALKVYLFVAALVFLGQGLKPLAEITIFKLSGYLIYWANSISAVLDNATLAAIEIVPEMAVHKIIFLTMGLVLAGGLLIPGNIPNIICASKLKIKSSEWAKVGLPYGVAAMVAYFIIMMAVLPHG
ncbi:Putative Mg transporter [Elusimicrobium minutum Pei191]|uniref:Putative Mg transporter n=1 Tax=Elusimicrobium minutum (strain Pei191) TaxID=445932 RepID=B2KEA7_ELUMP|nr:DUF1646 family protein [Elusimicrobium minutum]ACC98853.1 Putative Mg transporter [Elusimicrobium minutum Pei191]